MLREPLSRRNRVTHLRVEQQLLLIVGSRAHSGALRRCRAVRRAPQRLQQRQRPRALPCGACKACATGCTSAASLILAVTAMHARKHASLKPSEACRSGTNSPIAPASLAFAETIRHALQRASLHPHTG